VDADPFPFLPTSVLRLPLLTHPRFTGGTENERLENAGRSKMHGVKTRDWKTQNQTAELENAEKACVESQTVYFTCRLVLFNRISDTDERVLQ